MRQNDEHADLVLWNVIEVCIRDGQVTHPLQHFDGFSFVEQAIHQVVKFGNFN